MGDPLNGALKLTGDPPCEARPASQLADPESNPAWPALPASITKPSGVGLRVRLYRPLRAGGPWRSGRGGHERSATADTSAPGGRRPWRRADSPARGTSLNVILLLATRGRLPRRATLGACSARTNRPLDLRRFESGIDRPRAAPISAHPRGRSALPSGARPGVGPRLAIRGAVNGRPRTSPPLRPRQATCSSPASPPEAGLCKSRARQSPLPDRGSIRERGEGDGPRPRVAQEGLERRGRVLAGHAVEQWVLRERAPTLPRDPGRGRGVRPGEERGFGPGPARRPEVTRKARVVARSRRTLLGR